MSRILLIHWNASEAEERLRRLRTAGHEAELFIPRQGSASLRELRDHPPDAFVIDLARLPSHGRAVATALRQQKATRSVPIVFAGGDSEKVARLREALPDAVYTEWGRIRGDLTRAIRSAPDHPVAPGTMDGYSGTPLAKKLGIRASSVVALLGAPAAFEQKLKGLPDNVRVQRHGGGSANTILLFTKSSADLEKRFSGAAQALAERGGIWIVWPKQASGIASDLNQAAVRKFGLAAGFVDYKICAVDETWSGLLFTRRRK